MLDEQSFRPSLRCAHETAWSSKQRSSAVEVRSFSQVQLSVMGRGRAADFKSRVLRYASQ